MKHQAKYKISGHETFPLRYTWLPKDEINALDAYRKAKEEVTYSVKNS